MKDRVALVFYPLFKFLFLFKPLSHHLEEGFRAVYAAAKKLL